jgi:hypothetical protein
MRENIRFLVFWARLISLRMMFSIDEDIEAIGRNLSNPRVIQLMM